MSRARFIAAARLELLAEVIYYGETEAGLGARFAAAVEEAASRALAFPRSGSPSPSNTRRLLVRGFPFSLIYRPEPEGIVIFAVAPRAPSLLLAIAYTCPLTAASMPTRERASARMDQEWLPPHPYAQIAGVECELTVQSRITQAERLPAHLNATR